MEIGIKELLIGFVALAQVVSVKALFMLVNRLNQIRDHLSELNGRVKTCDAKRETHEQMDRDKHKDCEVRIHTVEQAFIHRQGAQ